MHAMWQNLLHRKYIYHHSSETYPQEILQYQEISIKSDIKAEVPGDPDGKDGLTDDNFYHVIRSKWKFQISTVMSL